MCYLVAHDKMQADYEQNIDANLLKILKKKSNRHDNDDYWPTSIK